MKQTNLLSKRNGLKQKEAIYEVDFRFNMDLVDFEKYTET